jgi:protein-disulfide isomerase
VPAFIFAEEIKETDFYSQASVLFEEKDKNYFLKGKEIGLPVGRFVEIPEIKEDDLTKGSRDAKVKVVVYADFLNPYSKMFQKTLDEMVNTYKEKIVLVQKNLPSETNLQSLSAALASECAYDQGKVWEYSAKLFAAQAEWGNAKNSQKLKDYARNLGLKADQFNKCLDEKKYQDKLNKNKEEAISFSITEAPFAFINDKIVTSFTPEELKSLIDAELAK